jgi:peptidoglycan/LPS O-acetylase OafA/YrhL
MVKSFSRVTTSGRYIPELDGMRFIAIAYVFVQHSQSIMLAHYGNPVSMQWDPFSTVIRESRIGVELFFVISGFILGLPFGSTYLCNGRPVSLSAFYLRRVTRLEPPYVISMIAFYVLLVTFYGTPASELFLNLIASLFYVHNYVYGEFSRINGVAWSLEVEVQFYLLVPLLAKFFLIRQKWWRRSTIIIFGVASFCSSRVIYRLVGVESTFTILSILPMMPYFMMGFVLADFYLTDWQKESQRSLRWDLVAAVSMIVLNVSFLTLVPARHLLIAALLFLFCYGVFRGKALRICLATAPIRTIGGMCYSIYLLHAPLMELLVSQWPSDPFTERASIIALTATAYFAAPILLVSALFFKIVERPCMEKDWPSRAWARLRSISKYRSMPGPAITTSER